VPPPPSVQCRVTSIYQRALGSDFSRLHPAIQRRFGFSSADSLACVGHGIMDEIWRGRFYTLPFLYVGTWGRIPFPEPGRNIPFTLENYAFVDRFGRETVSWIRTFHSRRVRRFDVYTIYSHTRGRIVEYLGSHQHLAVDVDLSVDREGGLRLRSGAKRFYEGRLGFNFPLAFSAIADVREWYDEKTRRFRVSLQVQNKRWGTLFGCRGSFDVEWRSAPAGQVPQHILPKRLERRE
jgi:hypothetical protein